MGVPTTAQAEVEIDAPGGGGLRPRHRRDPHGRVESRVRQAANGSASPARSDRPSRATTAPVRSGGRPWRAVLVADRPNEFSFATLYKDNPSTRWTYRFEGDGPDRRSPSPSSPSSRRRSIALAERLFLRNRQAQLEEGMAKTLSAIKAAAEARASR